MLPQDASHVKAPAKLAELLWTGRARRQIAVAHELLIQERHLIAGGDSEVEVPIAGNREPLIGKADSVDHPSWDHYLRRRTDQVVANQFLVAAKGDGVSVFELGENRWANQGIPDDRVGREFDSVGDNQSGIRVSFGGLYLLLKLRGFPEIVAVEKSEQAPIGMTDADVPSGRDALIGLTNIGKSIA